MQYFWILGSLLALSAAVFSLASTDSYRDADLPQSGYLPNHNVGPNTVGSSSFQTLWTFTSSDAKELWLAKPLVYTPVGGTELVITASEMNNIRVFNSKTGAIVKQRRLQPPFSSTDSNCGDVAPWIGVTGTPIIDPSNDILYVFSKGYRDGTTSGTANGVYKMYAVRIPSLEDVSGFPVVIDGMSADNDKTRYFVGGVAHQRPSLTDINGHIVAGFGSHCGRWNYTGYLVSVSKTPGVGVISMWSTEGSPGAPQPQPLNISTEKGGKAGIWQSGMGLATIGNNVYFVSGNGQGHENGNVPASGRLPMSTLDECIVKMGVSASGKLSLVDYFQPYDYTSLDGGDRDLGSSGLCILDGSVFRGTGVNRMGVVAGKEGRTYVVNIDNLGGFRQRSDGGDATIQTFELQGSLFGGYGSYPAEGGYIYATTVGGPLRAFKLGHDSNGRPAFSLAGTSTWVAAGRVGVGQMTITSENGKAGSGIVWVSDVTGGLVAFRAVPENGIMTQIALPSVQGANKYQRPVFGDGRVFLNINTNKLVALGSPVAAALDCDGPVDFGSLAIGSAAVAQVGCKANVAIAAVKGCSITDPSFRCVNSSLPQGQVPTGATFSFNVTWDLQHPGRAITPGFTSSSLLIDLSVPTKYASSTLLTIQGTAINEGPLLFTSPTEVSLGRLILRGGSSEALSSVLALQNIGNGTLAFIGTAFQDASEAYTNISSATGDLGSGFTSSNFPAEGNTLQPGESISIPVVFNGTVSGAYSTRVTLWSDGGMVTVRLTASINSPSAITFEVSDNNLDWVPVEGEQINFGNVMAGSSSEKHLRLCNKGGSPLTITISKPPATPQLLATNPTHDLTEGQQIDAGACSIGAISVIAAPKQPNHPSENITATWALNSDGIDPSTGKLSGRHDILLTATIVTKQIGPLLSNGTARFQYVGCFADTRLGRNLANQVNNATQSLSNTIQQCETLCNARGNIFAGLEYHKECWCGDIIKHPETLENEAKNLCTFDCKGDDTQACGGNGGHMSLFADITRFDIPVFLKNVSQPSTITPSATTGTSTGSSR